MQTEKAVISHQSARIVPTVNLFSRQATQTGIEVESAVRIKNNALKTFCKDVQSVHNTVIILMQSDLNLIGHRLRKLLEAP